MVMNVVVKEIREEADEIKSFLLASMNGTPLPAYTAGSHIDVHIRNNLVRQYSLAGDPSTGQYLIAVKKEQDSRGGSRAMHEFVRKGDRLKISEPRNNFRLVEGAKRHLLFAGGIGITPLLGMIWELETSGQPWELQYFSRSIRNTAFHDLLSAPKYAGKVSFHYAIERDAVRAYLRKHLWHREEASHLYLCGPRGFMDMVEQTAAITWPPEAVHLEHFAADPAALAGPRTEFKVRLARRQIECVVDRDQSICEALREQGVIIETSCSQGVCGTCVTGVLDGVPDHRDAFLTEAEKVAGDRLMPCVSRAKSEMLVLDI